MSARTYRALLIANSTFPADAQNLPDLEGPRNDPALLRDALCDGAAGLFPSDNIRLVTERTMAEVLRETEDFLSSASRQDTLLVYYSGHGLLDQRGELFLCTRDSRADRLRSTAVKASDVRGMMDESAALTTVVLLDCCHSGRFKGGVTPGTLAGRGRFVITSSRGGELANDAHVRNRASLFTHHLTEGLVRGAEDHDGDGVVNLSELYDYVHAALTTEGRQVPQKRFEGDGDVPVALRTVAREDPQPGLVAPAVAEPVLDLSDTVVDLGEVGADEILPPERIAVINRGGGSLAWTVESSAEWVDAVADETGVVLHLRPQPGPNRANVFVRDTATGELKTVRVSVRVRSAPAATAWAAPVVAAMAEATATEAPASAPAVEPAMESPPAVEPVMESPPAVEPVMEPRPAVEPAMESPPDIESEPVVAADPAAEAAAEAVAAEREVAAEAAALASAPPPEPAPSRRPGPLVVAIVAGALAVVAGILLMTTGFEAADVAESYIGDPSLLRNQGGPGFLGVILAGAVVALAGLAAVVFSRRGWALGIVAAAALPTGFERLAESSAGHNCACLGNDNVSFFQGAGYLCLGAAVVAAVALVVRRPWPGRGWPSAGLAAIALVSVVAWAIATLVDVYRYYGTPYGTYTAFGGTGFHLAAIVAVLAGMIVARWLASAAAREVFLGAAVLPVCATVSEIAYAIRYGGDDGFGLGGVAFFAVPAVILLAVMAVGGWASRGRGSELGVAR